MPDNYNLLVAIPTMGSIHPILASRLIYWGQTYKRGTIHFYFTFKVAPVDRARNQVVEYFLKAKTPDGKPFTHLLFIDSDTIPEPDAINRLTSHNLPIVSGLTPILTYIEDGWQTYDNCFVGREMDKDGNVDTTLVAKRYTGLQKIFRCGSSCILIERDVFEKLPKPHYLFLTNLENTKHLKSEDIYFCDQAHEFGFNIFADTDVVCQHYKDIMI